MDRFKLTDWQVINSALAYLEAEDPEAFAVYGDDAQDAFYEALASAREKVHQRLNGRTTAPWDGE